MYAALERQDTNMRIRSMEKDALDIYCFRLPVLNTEAIKRSKEFVELQHRKRTKMLSSVMVIHSLNRPPPPRPQP